MDSLRDSKWILDVVQPSFLFFNVIVNVLGMHQTEFFGIRLEPDSAG